MASFGKGVAEAVALKAKNTKTDEVSGVADGNWIEIQKKTFTNWTNSQLSDGGYTKVSNVEDDFTNGVALIEMLQQVSGKKIGKYSKEPKMKAHKLENLTVAFEFMKKEGITLVNIGPTDLEASNLKLVLGLLWTIIYHYQIAPALKLAAASGAKKGSARQLLLEWVQSKIPEFNIQNFTTDWNDGRALAALVNVIGGEPLLIPNAKQMISGAGLQNVKAATTVAEEYLDIPILISAGDMTDPDLDELSMMTYISYFRTAVRGKKRERAAPAQEEKKEAAPAAATFGKPAAAPTPAPAASPAKSAGGAPGEWYKDGSKKAPWERDPNWRKYAGEDLGGRCKIVVYYSTTTSSQVTRKNTENVMRLLEREKVHLRPDFKPWTPIDVDMDKSLRDKLFARAGTKETPMLFIDDEFIGSFDRIMELNESGELHHLLEY